MVEFLADNGPFREYLNNEFFKKIADLDKIYAKFYKVKTYAENGL